MGGYKTCVGGYTSLVAWYNPLKNGWLCNPPKNGCVVIKFLVMIK